MLKENLLRESESTGTVRTVIQLCQVVRYKIRTKRLPGPKVY
jgi:hypothetical protein